MPQAVCRLACVSGWREEDEKGEEEGRGMRDE